MPGLRTLLKSHSHAETIKIGEALGRYLQAGQVVALSGDLGTGKTTFVKGLAKGLGVKDERTVNSPTFVVMNQYDGRVPVYHLDLYRLEGLREVEEIGWDDLLASPGVVIVEWAKKIRGYLPEEYLEINFTSLSETEREIVLLPHGKEYLSLIKEGEFGTGSRRDRFVV